MTTMIAIPLQMLRMPVPNVNGFQVQVAMQTVPSNATQISMLPMALSGSPGTVGAPWPAAGAAPSPQFVENAKDDLTQTTTSGDSATDDAWDEDVQTTYRKRPSKKKRQSKGPGTLGTPVAPGRVTIPGVPRFDKQGCARLKEELKQGADISSSLDALTGRVWDLSQHAYGCRLVQLAMERGSQQQVVKLSLELKDHVLEAMISPHANYVLQKVVTRLTWQGCSFVADELRGCGVYLARHRFGCRVFCRLIEFHAAQEGVVTLVKEALQEAKDIMCDNYGQHVAQAILEHGIEEHRDILAGLVHNNPVALAKDQQGSYLVEKVILSSSTYQESVLWKLSSSLVDLALSRYGCYVARAVVEHPQANRSLETSKLLKIGNELNKTKHGQYLLADLGLGNCFKKSLK